MWEESSKSESRHSRSGVRWLLWRRVGGSEEGEAGRSDVLHWHGRAVECRAGVPR